MSKLSVVIITLNEEKNLPDCLKSVKGVSDEILILDSDSTDKTKALARKAGCKVINSPFKGYGPQKAKAVRLAKYDHVLCIDADERLSSELKNSIFQEKKRGFPAKIYSMNRRNWYLSGWYKRGGWYPDRKILLFSRKTTNWNYKIIHESVNLPKGIKPVVLDGDLLHYTYRDLDSHIRQINGFSSWSGKVLFSRGKDFSVKLYLTPVLSFFRSYILKGSFLCGKRGFVLSVMSAFSDFMKYARWWEMDLRRKKK